MKTTEHGVFRAKSELPSLRNTVSRDALEIQEIKSAEDLKTATRTGLTLVNFGAPWCAPCLLQEPILRRIAARFKGRAGIAGANIDENRQLAHRLDIRSIPTLVFFQNGKEIQRFVGLQSEDTLAGTLSDRLVRKTASHPLA